MSDRPEDHVRIETSQKRVRAYLGGELVADSRAPLLVWEIPYFPTYYLPEADVLATLVPAGEPDGGPDGGPVGGTVPRGARMPPELSALGPAQVCHVLASLATAERAARRYPDAADPRLRGAVRIDWDAMSEWLEEDEPVYTHPRDPYKRVDILASSRRVRVDLDGVTVAESGQPRVLFETGLPVRYYIPISDVRMDLLRPSTTSTHCPYKGTASYWSVDTGTRLHEDVVWIYRAPLPESQKIAGLACFYNERVDLFVDGQAQPRPPSPFG